jgi:two-component system sensor histidine kinase PilS (NtrC family)
MEKKNIFWLILIRVIIFTTFFISALTIQYSTAAFLAVKTFNLLILLVVFTYILSVIYFILYQWGKYYTFQVYLQILFDLLIITALVYLSGGLRGSFYFFYILIIIAASTVLSSRAAYITAALSCVFFGLLVDALYLKIIPYVDSVEPPDWTFAVVLYNIFIAWAVFFLVAFLINYLTKNLRKTRDKLDLAQRELEVKRRLAAVGEVSAQLAHEIRNPLAAISGSIQVLKSDLNLKADQERLMSIVVNESDRISQSLEQFMSLSSSGEQVFSWIDLSMILRETLFLLQRGGELNGNLKLEGNYDYRESPFYGNANQIKQIFLNLIKNSIKAMPSGGILYLNFDNPKKNELRFSIRDTGKGMTPEEKEKIFEPFFSKFSTGKGLGMSVVHRIVGDYKGKIQVQSEPDRGTEINITFPLLNAGRKKNSLRE